jgi:heat shock protein HspQ
LFAENADNTYTAYVSEQNLLPDESGEPIAHPQVAELFDNLEGDRYQLRGRTVN